MVVAAARLVLDQLRMAVAIHRVGEAGRQVEGLVGLLHHVVADAAAERGAQGEIAGQVVQQVELAETEPFGRDVARVHPRAGEPVRRGGAIAARVLPRAGERPLVRRRELDHVGTQRRALGVGIAGGHAGAGGEQRAPLAIGLLRDLGVHQQGGGDGRAQHGVTDDGADLHLENSRKWIGRTSRRRARTGVSLQEVLQAPKASGAAGGCGSSGSNAARTSASRRYPPRAGATCRPNGGFERRNAKSRPKAAFDIGERTPLPARWSPPISAA